MSEAMRPGPNPADREVSAVDALAYVEGPVVVVGVAEYLALQREKEAWRYRATHDHLTGLLNREGFEEQFQGVVERVRDHGVPAGLMLIDLNHFHDVNVRTGYDNGDRTLKQVGQFFKGREGHGLLRHPEQETIARGRRELSPGPNDLIHARLGGDEVGLLVQQSSTGPKYTGEERRSADLELRTQMLQMRSRIKHDWSGFVDESDIEVYGSLAWMAEHLDFGLAIGITQITSNNVALPLDYFLREADRDMNLDKGYDRTRRE